MIRSVRARAVAFVVPLVATGLVGVVGLVSGCAEDRRSLGEDCLKDQDCLSGICSQLRCAASPTYLDGAPMGPGAPPDASGTDAGSDTGAGGDGSDGSADAADSADTGASADSGGEGG
jgi:hypothetical protein